MSINLYSYSDRPYFSIDIDADTTGCCMVELLIDEYAKLAKEKLIDCDYDDAAKLCTIANDLDTCLARARRENAEKAIKEVEDDCA